MTPGSSQPSGMPPADRVPPEPAPPPSRYSFGQRAFEPQGSAAPPYPDPPAQPSAYGQLPHPSQSYEQPYSQPYSHQPSQPYVPPSQQGRAYGQHNDPDQLRTQQFPLAQPERNPYQVTPAQYYRDQGYGDPEPAQPYRLASSTLRKPDKRSSALGIASAVLVAGTLALCLFAAQTLGAAYAAIYLTLGTRHIERSQLTEAMVTPVIGPSMVVGIASLVGFIGLILGIIAAATKRGRVWGVGAIILGVLAPFLWGSLFMTAVIPAIEAVS